MKIIVTILLILMQGSIMAAETNVLSVKGNLFYLNGHHFDMWGLRTASATQSEYLTNKLLDALDEYEEVGLNTISLYLQGSSGQYSDPFNESGEQVDKEHWDRLVRIIEECDKRSMVVIVGIFYQRVMANERNSRVLSDNEESVFNAVKTVTNKLKPYRNVILNIANEHNSHWYTKFTSFNMRDPENVIALCRYAKEADPDRIVGGGGYFDEENVIIGKSQYVDALLFDTYSRDVENGHCSGWHYDYFRENGVTDKPLVNVEIFGGWTIIAMPPGVFNDKVRNIHLQEVEAAAERPGLSVHFHSNPWCQGPSIGHPARFDLGGDGTPENPGIRWWFGHARSLSTQ